MPNGGSDCCATCWFNQKNKGEVGYGHTKDAGDDHCVIRHTKIKNSFWTYCTNHPHHNPGKIDLPVGPLYVCAKDSYGREILQPSPDSEQIRVGLVILLESIEEQPAREFPAGVKRDEMIVWQLGEFREKRAVAGLERIARFDPTKSPGPLFTQTTEKLVTLAKEALAKIYG
jgi:hypothetical protein